MGSDDAGGAGAVGGGLILASASPRRRELLAMIGVAYRVEVSRFDESTLSHLADADTYVRAAAAGKADEVALRTTDGVVLGVDTDVVAPDGAILGKPIDAEDACRLLARLSGKTHHVYSGVCLVQRSGGEERRRAVRVVRTAVTFAALSDAAIRAYVASGEPMDKAGAYAIQGGAMAFAERIEGDLSSVIGLPLPALVEMLPEFGIPIWNTGPWNRNRTMQVR